MAQAIQGAGPAQTDESALRQVQQELGGLSAEGQEASSPQAQAALEAQEADLQQKIAGGIADAAAEAGAQMNEALSAMLQPLYDLVMQLKSVPPKIESLVDVDGAASSMYSQFGKLQQNVKQMNSLVVSAEVPITLSDYRASPQDYQNLLAIEYQKNELTEEDCENSGYTKTVWTFNTDIVTSFADIFTLPEDNDVVGKAAEQMIGSVIKTAWQVVKSPIQTIASIANIGPLPNMIQSVIDAVNAIVEVAGTYIPEKKLDEMLAQKRYAQEAAKAAAEKAGKPDGSSGESDESAVKRALATAKDTISQAWDGTKAGFEQAFSDFPAPSLPDGLKDLLSDFGSAIQTVKDNMFCICFVLVLKLLESVFKCFNQILKVLGVPSMPDPLGRVPSLVSDVISIMKFVLGLPVSIMKCVTAILKRKYKAIQVAMMPAPPLPLPEKVPVPPTSKDVPMPTATWDDVVADLQSRYGFGAPAAGEIVEAVRAFYDGSYEEALVIEEAYLEPVEDVGPDAYNCTARFEKQTRFAMTPLYCKDMWVPGNIRRGEPAAAGDESSAPYILAVPGKVRDVGWGGRFKIWRGDVQHDLGYDDDWCLLKEYRAPEESSSTVGYESVENGYKPYDQGGQQDFQGSVEEGSKPYS